MTSSWDRLGKLFALADPDDELANAILEDMRLGEDMLETALRKLRQAKLVFKPLDQQLDNVRRWNEERGWGFTTAQLDAVKLRGSSRPHNGLMTDVLSVFLPGKDGFSDVEHTFWELWAVVKSQHETVWPESWMRPNKSHLRLRKGNRHVPGIRVVTVDLGACWSPNYSTWVQSKPTEHAAHAEILAAAAHFPNWVRAMDGESVPFVWLPGYALHFSGSSRRWGHMPYLYWPPGHRGLVLTSTIDGGSGGAASPIRFATV